MPKRYPSDHKREALDLLEMHDYKVSIVRSLTGIPASTLYLWRDQVFQKNPDLIGRKNIAIPKRFLQKPKSYSDTHPCNTENDQSDQGLDELICVSGSAAGEPANADSCEDTVFLKHEERLNLLINSGDAGAMSEPHSPNAGPVAGVPGKTYPYPLEDDEEANSDLEDFRKIRDILMDHAHKLAKNLNPDDPDINRRSLALSRILDRVHQLDIMIPDLNPEKVLRIEYVYEGMVHNKPPGIAESSQYDAFVKWQRDQLQKNVPNA